MSEYVLIIITILLLICLFYYFINVETFRNVNINPATYNVKFVTSWGADKTINAPQNPHTGNMFLVSHNVNFELFKVGQFASKEIANTAMYGSVDDLLDMVTNNGNVGDVVTNDALMAPGEVNLRIKVPYDKTHLSFVTMIAPSSNWFIGFSVNMMPKWGWTDGMIIPLYVYDAGTDANQGFVTEHKPKFLADPISVINNNYLFPDNILKPIAHVIITRIQ